MKGYTKLSFLRIFGAPVHVHWSALVIVVGLVAGWIKEPFSALAIICSYFGIILLHESGHAYFALRLGCRPINIYLSFIHGVCEHHAPYSFKDECIIAWGGVSAQFAVAIPLIVLAQTTSLTELPIFGILIVFFGYINAFIAIVNLAPAKGLDGANAWRLIPLLIKQYRRKAVSKKIVKGHIRHVK